MYQEGISCPYCYQSKSQTALATKLARQSLIRQIASEQPGCIAYENRRWVSVPRRCAGMQLIDALQEIYPPYTQVQWLDAIRSGEITAPAATKSQWKTVKVEPDLVVNEGQRFLHAIPSYTEPPINPDILLVHEDEAIVVVDKSAPLPLHPSGRFQKNSLEWILHQAYFPEKLRPAHRIDAMTTGLVVFTRKYAYASKVQSQFAEGKVRKTYLAWVNGIPNWQQTRCEFAISHETLPNGGRTLDPAGQSAVTEFKLLRTQADRSLIEASPLTGRTHQIRLHLAALGHPIIGDPLYLPGGISRPGGISQTTTPRPAPDVLENETSLPSEHSEPASTAMLLHAWKLAFVHPLSGSLVEFTSDR
ncbi:MAG: RluA family pseudouridine synthase, partial [Pirellula sp.]